MPVKLKQLKSDMLGFISQVRDKKTKKMKLVRTPIRLDEYPSLFVGKLEKTASPGVKTVTYTAKVKSEKPPIDRAATGTKLQTSAQEYITTIRFHDVRFEDTEFTNSIEASIFSNVKDKKTGEVKKVLDGVFYHEKLSVDKHAVSLKGLCTDFRHRWETPLKAANAVIGQPRKYNRLTPPPPVGRPFRNPKNKLGMCKHVWNLLLELREKGEVSEF